MKTLRERMRYAWQQSGKSQIEIAKDCNVSREAVSQWVATEQKKSTNPEYTNLVIFAQSTGYNLNWLLTGEPPQKKNGFEGNTDSDRAKELDVENLLKAVDIYEKFLPSSKYRIRLDDRADIIDRIRKLLGKKPPYTAEILRIVTPIRQKLDKRSNNKDGRRARRGDKGSDKGRDT